MKLVFVSNLLTPHQEPVCNEFYRSLNGNFKFIETIDRSIDLPNGWKPSKELPSYLITFNGKIDIELINNADVVLFGSAPDSLLLERVKNNKLTFKYSERFYKEQWSFKNFFRRIIGTYLHHGKYKKYPLFMMCASSFTSKDCNLFGNYKNRMYKWGYFPKTKTYSCEYFENKYTGEKMSIIWVGRFIDWKHPEIPVMIAKILKERKVNFCLTMIGTGDLFENIQDMVDSFELNDNIQLLGALSPDEVRKQMELHQLFLFTSDRNEGWGAVLNEAMNSGCCCMASNAIGSSSFLIKDGYNGYIYEDGDLEEIANKIIVLNKDNSLMKTVGRNAYNTILYQWNSSIAAERFIHLAEVILSEKTFYMKNNALLYDDGPCSVEK